jgi:hypothetical protein
MRPLRVALMAVTLLLGACAAVAGAAGEGSICRELREDTGLLRLPGPEGRLSVIVTGDSMSYPIDQEMAIGAPRGMLVHVDRHDGTGLTTTTVDWARLAARQVAHFHPATVVSLGGRDGGIALPDPAHGLLECCGRRWLRLYANLLRPLVRAYGHGGSGHVYWLTLPAPAEAARAPFYQAVNGALALLVPEFPRGLTLIGVDRAVSPGGFQEAISYEGLQIRPRTPDGIHLNQGLPDAGGGRTGS